MVLKILFIVFLIIGWVFTFLAAGRYQFKEDYKMYIDKSVDTYGDWPPAGWTLSRRRNHTMYNIFKGLAVVFLIIATAFGSVVNDLMTTLIATLMLPFCALIPLGLLIGKKMCRRAVKRQCMECHVKFKEDEDYEILQKNLQGFPWRFLFMCNKLVNFKFYYFFYLLNLIKI